jgi:hypothetical protein
VNQPRRVYGVHITQDSLVGHVEVIFGSEADAREHALARSTHPAVLRASVTEFTLGELGTFRPVVWFRHGEADPNRRPFPTDGPRPAHGGKAAH